MTIGRGLLAGLAGGAAGTTALNAVTYLDMVIRGRGTSSTPEDTVEAIATKTGQSIPGDKETRKNRDSGLGALTGILAGVGVGRSAGRGSGRRVATPADHRRGRHRCRRDARHGCADGDARRQ